MLYKNNSSEAEAACERQRTGNYGADEFEYSSQSGQERTYTNFFKIWRTEDIMASIDLSSEPRLHDIKNCKILKDLTPDRKLSDKIYLCKCNICGSTFTRCRKTLVFKHSDCGCEQTTGFKSGIYTDKLILEMDSLSKKVLLAKINALNKPLLSDVFKALGFARLTNPSDREIMDRWFDDMGFSAEEVLDACRAAGGIREPSLRYVNKILENRMLEKGGIKASYAGGSGGDAAGDDDGVKVSRKVLKDYYEHIRDEEEKAHAERIRDAIANVPGMEEVYAREKSLGAALTSFAPGSQSSGSLEQIRNERKQIEENYG